MSIIPLEMIHLRLIMAGCSGWAINPAPRYSPAPEAPHGRVSELIGAGTTRWNCFGSRRLNEYPTWRAAAMRLQTYRDESRSRHFDLTGGRGHPWSIDLVAVIASGLLLMGFACAPAAVWVH